MVIWRGSSTSQPDHKIPNRRTSRLRQPTRVFPISLRFRRGRVKATQPSAGEPITNLPREPLQSMNCGVFRFVLVEHYFNRSFAAQPCFGKHPTGRCSHQRCPQPPDRRPAGGNYTLFANEHEPDAKRWGTTSEHKPPEWKIRRQFQPRTLKNGMVIWPSGSTPL